MSRRPRDVPPTGGEDNRSRSRDVLPASGEDSAPLAVRDRPEGARLSVQVKPRASRTQFLGVRDGALIVAVTAPPVDGEANAALVRAVAEILGVAVRNVVIASGHGSKHKIVDVRGMNAAAVRDRLRLSA